MSKGCSKILAVFFAILFILAATSAISLYQLEFRFLSPEPYVELLGERDLQTRLVDIAAKEFAVRLDFDPCAATPELCDRAGGPPVYLTRLSEEDLEQIIQLLITPAWVADQGEVLVAGLFNLLTPGEEPTTIALDLQPVKAGLRGQAGEQVIEIVLAAMPECTPEQVAQLGQLLIVGGSVDQLLVCSPPPELISLAMPILEQQIDILAAELPGVMIVDLANVGVQGKPDGVMEILQAREVLRSVLLLSVLAAAASLSITLLFTVRSFRDLFIWTGWPVLVVGLLVLVACILARGTLEFIASSLAFSQQAPLLQPQTSRFILDLAGAVAARLLREVVFLAIGLVAGGLFLLILATLMPGRPRESAVGRRPESLY